jgi:hypothetical protein
VHEAPEDRRGTSNQLELGIYPKTFTRYLILRYFKKKVLLDTFTKVLLDTSSIE